MHKEYLASQHLVALPINLACIVMCLIPIVSNFNKYPLSPSADIQVYSLLCVAAVPIHNSIFHSV